MWECTFPILSAFHCQFPLAIPFSSWNQITSVSPHPSSIALHLQVHHSSYAPLSLAQPRRQRSNFIEIRPPHGVGESLTPTMHQHTHTHAHTLIESGLRQVEMAETDKERLCVCGEQYESRQDSTAAHGLCVWKFPGQRENESTPVVEITQGSRFLNVLQWCTAPNLEGCSMSFLHLIEFLLLHNWKSHWYCLSNSSSDEITPGLKDLNWQGQKAAVLLAVLVLNTIYCTYVWYLVNHLSCSIDVW